MIFNRIKSEGLSHFSYFLGSKKEAIVIDPRRDCQIYIDLAKTEKMKIKYIFETHRNEDYVIGSMELSHFTGAKIFHGSGLDFKFGEKIEDNQVFSFGRMKLRAIYTPGHTDESMSYSLIDESLTQQNIMVFTGDALFVGDVGRTDLYGEKETPRLAENLYDSIFNKILPLGDGVILCPAHGGGSICGGSISDQEWSTLGLERLNNPILQKSKKEFIKFKINEKLERPPYFTKMEQMNLNGPPILYSIPSPPPLSSKEFKNCINDNALILDVRKPSSFGGSYIKESVNIWLDGLPAFGGWVLSYDQPIVLILDNPQNLKIAVKFLIRLGFDKIDGYLCDSVEDCGIESWYNDALPTEHGGLLTVQELKNWLHNNDDLFILDVRTDNEWEKEHIENINHIYVGNLKNRLTEIPKNKPIAVICSVGNRGSIGASILRQANRKNVSNVIGGMIAWKKAGYPVI
ncbi:MAG: MBL fold metallo-hydrolase [Candidatus Bathyarchaeota archaeon]